MKKLLTLVLVMVLVLSSLTACSVDEIKGTVTDTFNTVKEKVTDTFDTVKKTVGGWFGIEFPDEEPDEPEVTYDVEAAKDYIYQLYVKGSYETPVDYKVVKQVFIKKVPHDVTWTTSSELVKVIVNETDVTIDVDEKATEDLVYTLTATVNAADGTSATVSFERMVPKYELLGYAQYLEKKTGEAVTVEGIVTLARSQSAGNKRDQLFIQDMNGVNGYYVYYTDKDYVKEIGLKVGMKVSVTGIKEIYGATHEIKEASVTILDETITTLTPNDITELFKTNTDPKAAALMDRLGSLVTIKGVVIGGQDLADSSKYLYFEMEGGCKTYVRVYTTDLGVGVMNAEQEAAVFEDHRAKRDYLANVTGVVDVYSDAIYISPVGPTPFEFLTKVERTPAQKIDIAISELKLPESIDEAGEITVPTTGAAYPEVTFGWASSNTDVIAVDGGKLTVTLPEETTTVTLTLKANCEGATEVVKTYDIKVYAAASDLYVPKDVKEPVKGVAYKLYLAQNNIGQTLYFAGSMSGNFLATITDAANATDVYLEEVLDGETVVGYRMYFMEGEAKKYIDAHEYAEGKVGVRLTAEPSCVWVFDKTLGVMTTTVCEKIWYLGTYSTYNTMSLSETWRISGEKAGDVGVSQFPAKLADLAPAAYAPSDVKEPVKGVAYKLYLAQNNIGQTLYFAGSMSGNFLATITDAANATDVYLEEVLDGETVVGYRMYFMEGEAKKYIDAHEYAEGKVGVRLTAEPSCVWVFDKTLGVMTTTVCEKIWYLGTYSTYNTMSLSETWRISGEKAGDVGVSQFPAKLATLLLKEVAPKDVETPVKDTEYKLYLSQNNIGQTLYFTGAMDGNFLATTTKISQAVAVCLEEVLDGETVVGYRMYFMEGEAKKYIDAHEYAEGKVGVRLTAEPSCVWVFDKTLGVMTTTVCEKIWYLGTYSTYNTMSLSETWRISGEKAGDVGVSQFPVHLATIEFVKDEVVEPDTPDTPGEEPEESTAIELPITDDIATSTSGNASSYNDRTTTNGWSASKAALISGKTWMGENVYAWAINGKKDNCGKIVSPLLKGSLSYIEFNYGFHFADTNKFKASVSVVSASGAVLVSNTIEKTGLAKENIYSYRWILTEEEAAKVTGEYTIVIENLGLSASTSNSDRLAIWNIKLSNEAFVVPAADKVAAEKAALKFPFETVNFDRVITLPTVKEYTDVAITWEISENSVATLADGKVTVTTGDAAETVTLTATLKCGDEATDTKTFEVKINAKSPLNVTKVTAPEAGKAYKIYLRQFNADNVFFVNGGVTDGRFDTTTSLEDAIDVYVEVVEDGVFKFYGGTDANRMYVNVDKDGNISLAATTDCVFKYDADKNCWYTTVVTSEEGAEKVTKDYYLGSHSNYTNVSASKTSYINASNTGVSQFPAELVTLVCNHLWDSDCDTTCGVCGETREVNASHTYDADCTDADCNLCGATRTAAAAHVYDADCTDTTCNNAGCQVTREAQTHVYDADCTDATCNNAGCQVTREAAAAHVYDADCTDATCNNEGCQVTREAAAAHVYDADCTDTTCNNEGCQVTREAAAAHVYDADCTDATCNNEGCEVTRTAADAHVYDADCTDATCNNEGCQVTREAAAAHVYDADCTDATCNNEGCEVTRTAAEAHVYDADCTDTTCNNAGCSVIREAQTHVYADGCTDTTCEKCAHTREAEHNFTGKCGNTCTECGAANPDAKTCVDSDSDNACDNCGVEMDANGDTTPAPVGGEN